MNLRKKKPRADQMLAEVQDLAYRLAWDAAAQYNWPFDECLREAYWQFMKAYRYYDPAKGTKFSTFYSMIYKWQIKSRIKEMGKRHARLPQIEFKENLRGVLKLKAPADRSPCLDAVGDLSADAREIVQLLVETPEELLKGVLEPHWLFNQVKKYLINHKGYSKERFLEATEEIRAAFHEVWKPAPPPPPPPPPPPNITPTQFRSLFVRNVIGFAPADNTV